MSKVVIAFAGRKGHGKDFCAHLASDLLLIKTERVSFADPIKDMACELFQWDGKKDKKGRKFLQLLGSEVGRCYYNNIWLDKALKKIKESTAEVIFNTDLRFPHEFNALEALREQGYVVVFVKVVKSDGLKQKLENIKHWFRLLLGLEHSSERGFADNKFGYVIDNDFQATHEVVGKVKKILIETGLKDLRGDQL